MSGSGGGGRTTRSPITGSPTKEPTAIGTTGQTSGASEDPCDIIEVTTLNSPNRTVLATLRPGDPLDIQLREGPPQQLLATRGNEVAGSITSAASIDIIRCIRREGRTYQAVVSSVRGGLCKVTVQPQ